MTTHPAIILASASPRRRELLREMGVDFEVQPAGIDEERITADHPRTYAIRVAYAKATAIARDAEPGRWVLAADTVVTRDMVLFAKPRDRDEARWMLGRLSGGAHDVITAVALARAGSMETLLRSATTRVVFRDLTAEEIEEYIATTEPYDKAGGYGIQGAAAAFIARIEGDYFNVVGLPCEVVFDLLCEALGGGSWNLPAVPARWRTA